MIIAAYNDSVRADVAAYRCDSYNTAQISISSGYDARSNLQITDVPTATLREDSETLIPETVQTFSRGRSLRTNSIVRRSALSAPGIEHSHHSSHSAPHLRGARSTSITAISRFAFPDSGSVSSEDEDPIEDEDDVDFWGRPGANEKLKQDPLRKRRNDAEDDGDELMDDELEDSEDDEDEEADDDDDDEDEEDHMEIFGHR